MIQHMNYNMLTPGLKYCEKFSVGNQQAIKVKCLMSQSIRKIGVTIEHHLECSINCWKLWQCGTDVRKQAQRGPVTNSRALGDALTWPIRGLTSKAL